MNGPAFQWDSSSKVVGGIAQNAKDKLMANVERFGQFSDFNPGQSDTSSRDEIAADQASASERTRAQMDAVSGNTALDGFFRSSQNGSGSAGTASSPKSNNTASNLIGAAVDIAGNFIGGSNNGSRARSNIASTGRRMAGQELSRFGF
jgi:hypothetical protein